MYIGRYIGRSNGLVRLPCIKSLEEKMRFKVELNPGFSPVSGGVPSYKRTILSMSVEIC